MIKNHGVVEREAVHAHTYFTKLTPHLSSYTALVLPFTRFTNSLRFFKIGHVHDTQNEVIGRELVGPHSDIHSGICRCYGDATSRARKATPEQTPWYTELDMSEKTCINTANSWVFGTCPNKWNIWSHFRIIHVLPLTQFFPFPQCGQSCRISVFSQTFHLFWTVFGKFLPRDLLLVLHILLLVQFLPFAPDFFFFAINCPVSV